MYAGKIVETGTIDEIFYDPRHPYTWGLLSSMPDLETDDDELYTIPGTPPNLIHEVKGDAFAPRNAYALNIDNGLIVNVDTHEIITARAIVNEESLLNLCEELGWKTDWYIVYKNLVL